MKKAWISHALAAVVLASSTSAMAWVALAVSDSGYSHIETNVGSEEGASRQTLKTCAENAGVTCKLQLVGRGTAMVFAAGKGGGSGTAIRPDPVKARDAALAICRKNSTECMVLNAAWDAGDSYTTMAASDNNYFLALNNASTTEAEATAIEGCEKISKGSKCKVREGFMLKGPGYLAVSRNGVSSGIGFAADKSSAVKIASENCQKDEPTGTVCKSTEADIAKLNPPMPEPAGMKAIYAEVVANKAKLNKKPKITATSARTASTQRLSCSNQCYNGACTRTFADGRKEQWQAPRVFDPIQNNWGWDTTTNACGL